MHVDAGFMWPVQHVFCIFCPISLCQVTEEVIEACITARQELEKACEPLKGKKAKKA